jgi:hypothetical protein
MVRRRQRKRRRGKITTTITIIISGLTVLHFREEEEFGD